MRASTSSEFCLWKLFCQLRRRQFPLGPADFQALRHALQLGYGWEHEALRDLCCLLWAKSRREQEILCTLFDQYEELYLALSGLNSAPGGQREAIDPGEREVEQPQAEEVISPSLPLVTERLGGLPPVILDLTTLPRDGFNFEPQYPLSFREVAQIWRRLRRPLRVGPPTELDIAATVQKRSRLGIGTPPVMVPRRRNRERLLLLCDRRGSMSAFHDFAAHVCAAIVQAGRLEHVEQYYFHDVPVAGGDRSALNQLTDSLFPTLDSILSTIAPAETGWLFSDPDLRSPESTRSVLSRQMAGTAVVVVSDGGAAHERYDVTRLHDTVAFFKALRRITTRYVWLNPLPVAQWSRTTAEQIARHVPMFPMDRMGMYAAVNLLHGRPPSIERPL